MADIYLYEIDDRFIPLLALFGLRPKADGVTIGEDGVFSATLGWFRVATPMSNIEGAHITRHYRWWTAIGARRSFADDGLTFGTNSDAGVCLHFGANVPSLLRRKGHSALTVTVSDVEGLVRSLSP